MRPRSLAFRRWFAVVAIAVLAMVVVYLAMIWRLNQWAEQPLSMTENSVAFRVPAGAHVPAIVEQVRQAGVDLDESRFIWLAKRSGKAGELRAGGYELKRGATAKDLLAKLIAGEVALADIRLPEGFTFRQWQKIMAQSPWLRHDSAAMSEMQLLEALGLGHYPGPEGLFFPDTYRLDKGGSDIELLRRASRLMQQRLNAVWNERAAHLPYKTPYEAMIMASIIEKETGQDADRPLVAAVFVNRLRLGMRLQTDPTVIYGIGERFDGNLRKNDLLTPTPYNTYTQAGLPPTPICMFSLASLMAALHPAESRALYFVARGDGSSEFSETLSAHNAAVAKYQLRR